MSTEQQAEVKRRSSRAAREGRRRRRARSTAAATTSVPSIDQASAAAETELARAEEPQLSRAEARRQAKAESAKAQRRGIISTERSEGLRRFIRETKAEIDKVVWPDRETTINLTLLVIGLSVVLGILLGGIDFLLYQVFEAF